VTSVWDIAAVSALSLMAWLYYRGCDRLVRRTSGASGRPARSAGPSLVAQAAFWVGWALLVVSVLPPIDHVAVDLLSVHMVQHGLMMILGAPLVMAGRPLPVVLVALPVRLSAAAAAALQSPVIARSWRLATTPLIAWLLHGLAIWVWHLPRLYEAAVVDEMMHAAQHAAFVGTAMLFWWGLLQGRYGRAGYGAAVFYTFATAVHTGALGALMTFARRPLYGIYATRAALRGSDPVADQQLAGLLMWVPAGFILTVMGVALFAAWLAEAERRERQAAST
jgi:putative membrane protein